METDNGLDFLPARYLLQNARGEEVDLVSYKLMGYSPTGLGVSFSNSYYQYDNYFSLTKSKVNQGQMSMNIMFGDIESDSYSTFSEFSTFLSYQPLTLVYSSPSGSWSRDARVLSMNKSEIGGGVNSTDKLNESFTMDFINVWYNNKKSQYIRYEADPGLAVFGRGYFINIPGKPGKGYFYGDSEKYINYQQNQIVDKTALSI